MPNLTLEEFLELPEEPGYKQELLEGELILTPITSYHADLTGTIVDAYRDLRNFGYLCRAEMPIELSSPLTWTNPATRKVRQSTILIPDVLMIEMQALSHSIVRTIKGNIPKISPPLIIEIKSPGNSEVEMLDKTRAYLKNGSIEV